MLRVMATGFISYGAIELSLPPLMRTAWGKDICQHCTAITLLCLFHRKCLSLCLFYMMISYIHKGFIFLCCNRTVAFSVTASLILFLFSCVADWRRSSHSKNYFPGTIWPRNCSICGLLCILEQMTKSDLNQNCY